jgi:hypothetical protein
MRMQRATGLSPQKVSHHRPVFHSPREENALKSKLAVLPYEEVAVVPATIPFPRGVEQ